ISANDRIATDPNRSRLPNAALRQLMYRLVSQRARARDDANRSLFVNGSWHDADLALTWRNNSRTVRPDQARSPVLQELPSLHHVERWNAFSDAYDQIDFRVGRFHNGVRSERRRRKDHRCIGARLIGRL